MNTDYLEILEKVRETSRGLKHLISVRAPRTKRSSALRI